MTKLERQEYPNCQRMWQYYLIIKVKRAIDCPCLEMKGTVNMITSITSIYALDREAAYKKMIEHLYLFYKNDMSTIIECSLIQLESAFSYEELKEFPDFKPDKLGQTTEDKEQ